jgi:MFS family permease
MTEPYRADQWRALIALALLIVFLNLDFYGISIALPVIGRDLSGSTALLGWALNAYLLAFAATIITFSRLADIVGLRRMAIAGIALFIVSSILSGLSTNGYMLVGSRALVGAGSAMLAATSLPLVGGVFSADQRSQAIGLWAAIGILGGAVGPFICGIFTEALSWQWFFFANAAVAACSLVLVLAFVKETATEGPRIPIDIAGFLALTLGVVLLVLGLEFVETFGWQAPQVIGSLIGGVVVLICFYVIERVVRFPLIDFSLFEERDFLGACLVSFLAYLPYGAFFLFLTLFLQHVIGLSPILAGVVFLAMMAPFMAVSLVGGRLLGYLGQRQTLAIAMSFIALSFVCFGYVRIFDWLSVVPLGLILFGVGQGLCYNVSFVIAIEAAPDNRSAEASGVLQSVRWIAAPLGVAAFGALFRSDESERLAHLYNLAGSRLDAAVRAAIHARLSGSESARSTLANLVPDLAGQVDVIVDEAFSHAFRNTMLLSIALSVIGIVASFLVRSGAGDERPLEVVIEPPGPAESRPVSTGTGPTPSG